MVSKRTIPENLGGQDDFLENAPFVGRVEAGDGLFAFIPPLISFIVLNNMNVPGTISWGVPALLIVVGVSVLMAKPDYISLTEIISNYYAYRQMPDEITKKVDTRDYDYSEPAPVQAGDDETVSYIGIKRLYPRNNAVLKEDDTAVGMVEVGGLNLDIQADERLKTASASFEDFINNQLADRGYEIQLYMPMRRFNPGNQVSDLDARKDDKDIVENEFLSRYVEDRKRWMEEKLSKHLVRKFYMVVEVSEREAADKNTTASGGIDVDKLPMSEVIKGIQETFSVGSSGISSMSESELREAQMTTLNERLNFVSNNMKQSDNQHVKKMSADEMGVLLREFWEGEYVRQSEIENYIRRKPVVTKKR